MARTLHFVVRVTVDEYMTVDNVQRKIAYVLNRFPVTKYNKPRVWRPRGRFGVWLRKLDS